MSLARAVRKPSVASRPTAKAAARPSAPAVVVAPPPPPAPAAATPTEIEFWDFRYRTNRTPWDAGRAPVALLQWLERNPPRRRHILIPGCGRGHEIFSFSGSGWNTTALDVSPAAIEKVKRRAKQDGPLYGEGCNFQASENEHRPKYRHCAGFLYPRWHTQSYEERHG